MEDHNTLLCIYDLSLSVQVSWQAHSLSNSGTNGSNRTLPRRQLLANNAETDACNGNILKHHHAMLAADYLAMAGVSLCAACSRRDGRRAAALVDQAEYRDLTIERILHECGLCDAHGFLITAKNGTRDGSVPGRQRLCKHSLMEFSFALGLPERHAESVQIQTRYGQPDGEGLMIMKVPSRSGEYAQCVRYRAAGIGVDTEIWDVIIQDEVERVRRHQALLSALRDQFLSPSGAMTPTKLPHLTGLKGAFVVRTGAGRAPMYSPLDDNFVEILSTFASDRCHVLPFATATEFNSLIQGLIEKSVPALPAIRRLPPYKN